MGDESRAEVDGRTYYWDSPLIFGDKRTSCRMMLENNLVGEKPMKIMLVGCKNKRPRNKYVRVSGACAERSRSVEPRHFHQVRRFDEACPERRRRAQRDESLFFNNLIILLTIALVCFPIMLAAQTQLDVKAFGAKGDGTSLETAAMQRAIDKAYENGGGVVNVPPGTYKVGTLILKDNIDLHVQAGAEIIGSPNIADYQEIIHKYESRTNGLYAKHFVLFAEGARNISISGSGTVHGNGLKNFRTGNPQNLRPFLARLVNCDNVTIRDVHLLESANWTLHLLGCRDVNIDGIVIENGVDANRDGLDIDCCQRVTVANSRFSTGDDAIVLKATNDVLCEDIAITNCVIRTRASAIKTGTESNGGFRNITVSNCTIRDLPHHAGIELMTVDGGMMQNIIVDNITMINVATPFFVRLGVRARPYKPGQYVARVDDVRDITLSNISVTNAKYPSSIMGLHSKKISNVTVNNYTVRYGETEDAVPYNKVPFMEFLYPYARMFQKLPAYGLYCRNVEGLHLQNISVYSAVNEKRPPIAFDRVNRAEILSVKAEVRNANAPFAHLRSTKDLIANYCRTLGAAKVLFEVEQSTSDNLKFSNNIIQAGQQETVQVPALPDDQLFEEFDTDIRFSVDQGATYHGLTAHELKGKPLAVDLGMTKRGPLQLCLLVLNESPTPEKLLLKYEGKSQEFVVSWNEWGWAPISLLKEYDNDAKVRFEITAVDPNSQLKIAKAYVRYQNLKKTD
jgi:polygalacturonase